MAVRADVADVLGALEVQDRVLALDPGADLSSPAGELHEAWVARVDAMLDGLLEPLSVEDARRRLVAMEWSYVDDDSEDAGW